MKYLKKFESYDEYVYISYWKIPTKDPDLTIALEKIKKTKVCYLNRGDFYSFTREKLFSKDEVYILKVTTESINIEGYTMRRSDWLWLESEPNYWNLSNVFKDKSIVSKDYNGKITVSKKEIDQYNLEQDTNKYNL